MLKATMYFSYERDARSGLNSKTIFDAILASERSSTTRCPSWLGYERWKDLKVGDQVRFYANPDMKGRYVDVTVTEFPRIIDLAACGQSELAAQTERSGNEIRIKDLSKVCIGSIFHLSAAERTSALNR